LTGRRSELPHGGTVPWWLYPDRVAVRDFGGPGEGAVVVANRILEHMWSAVIAYVGGTHTIK